MLRLGALSRCEIDSRLLANILKSNVPFMQTIPHRLTTLDSFVAVQEILELRRIEVFTIVSFNLLSGEGDYIL